MFRKKALGRYVDLRCVEGLTSRDAFNQVCRSFNRKVAKWCLRVCGDTLPVKGA